jgi:hypothetical protein
MTMTRPCLRMILHLLQIFFTLGLTFIVGLLWRTPAFAARAVLVSYLYR